VRTRTKTREYFEACSLCHGTGKEGETKEGKVCRRCKGAKVVLHSREVTVIRED
jgi:DnaJ-class molecular chaperone